MFLGFLISFIFSKSFQQTINFYLSWLLKIKIFSYFIEIVIQLGLPLIFLRSFWYIRLHGGLPSQHFKNIYFLIFYNWIRFSRRFHVNFQNSLEKVARSFFKLIKTWKFSLKIVLIQKDLLSKFWDFSIVRRATHAQCQGGDPIICKLVPGAPRFHQENSCGSNCYTPSNGLLAGILGVPGNIKKAN